MKDIYSYKPVKHETQCVVNGKKIQFNTMKTIQEKYEWAKNTTSDINEHIPVLKEYADKCEHVTEMGVRGVVSTYAFLNSNAKKVIGIDIVEHPNVLECQEIAENEGKDWTFICADVLKIEIEPTDFLFIDTFHTAAQLEKELALHADKVKKYIGFHDTTTFWLSGEYPANDLVASNQTNCGRGLKYAIEPFLEKHPEWKVVYRTEKNNGLLIIERNED